MADPMKENEQELRLAVAMRGGASMAVWIGGATAELNCLREVLAGEPDHPWSALARLAGYDSVSIDVLAGTSAGGLNATLLSAAVVYGMPFDDMRSVWVRLADVEAMAREVPKFWEPDPPSLLDGDGYFRRELARILKQHVRSADDSRIRGDHAELLLTATLLDPLVEDHVDGRGGGIEQQRRDASFRFRHRGRPGQPLSDFGAGKEFDDTVLRMAQAARTTSSFPFAFEPAQVHSTVDRPPGGEPDMFGLFSETAKSHALPFRVIDGGVLDNIPVTAAIEAIAQAPADRPTNRWLLYLNPDPELFREDRPPHRQFALPVVSEVMQAKLAEESLLTDIEALDEHNRGVARRALLRRSLFAEVSAHSPQRWETVLAQRAAALESEHAAVRAQLDAQAVHRMLTEHSGAEDGTLLPPVVGDPLDRWSPIARAELGRRLSQRMGKQAGADEVFADVRSLLSGVWQCLTWVWDIERWVDQACVAEIGECKAALYRLRAFGLVLEGHADRYWFDAAKQEPIVDIGDLDGWVARVLERRCRLQHRLPSSVGPLVDAVVEAVEHDRRFQPALAEFAAEIQSIMESTSVAASADKDDAETVDAVAHARAALTRIADRLAAVAPARGELEAPEALAHAVLERSDDRSVVLRHLVVLTAALDAGRMSATRINLLRVSADQQTPLPFESLRRNEHGPLRTDDKVRGGDLANFSAFLSAQWRANDWMWGRIDTATSIIALLLDPARLVRQNADLGAEGLHAALGTIVCTPSSGELGELDAERAAEWRGFLEQVWSRHHDGVRAELADLFERPDGEHPLERTKKALCERLHWTISATEVAYIAQLSPDVASMESASPQVPNPQRLFETVRTYDVGRQRLPDLGEPRLATLATRFGLLAYRAARPSGSGLLSRMGRWALTVCKPLLMTVLLAVAAPKRVAAIGFAAVSTIMLAETGGARGSAAVLPGVEAGPVDVGRGDWPVVQDFSVAWSGTGTLVAGAFVFAFGTWLSHQLIGRGSGPARWVPALVLAAGLTAAASWLFWSGLRLGPLAVTGIAAVLTWFATVAYRPSGRIMAALVSAVLFSPLLWPVTSYGDMWLLTTILLTAYVQMILVSTVDVLRPRPGH